MPIPSNFQLRSYPIDYTPYRDSHEEYPYIPSKSLFEEIPLERSTDTLPLSSRIFQYIKKIPSPIKMMGDLIGIVVVTVVIIDMVAKRAIYGKYTFQDDFHKRVYETFIK